MKDKKKQKPVEENEFEVEAIMDKVRVKLT